MQPIKPLKLLRLAVLGSIFLAFRSFAQYDTVWTGTTGNFLDQANWSVLVPTNNNTFNIDNGGTATLDTSGGVAINYFDLGDTGTGSGNLVISNGEVTMAQAVGDSYSQVGLNDNTTSSFVMDGGTNYFDGPQATVVAAETGTVKVGELWTYNPALSGGVNGVNFYVGTDNGSGVGAIGNLELHSNAVMRIGHVLALGLGKTGAPNFEQASLVMDGNAELSIGDGFGFGKSAATCSIDLSGNSRLVVGDSMGLGSTNGYSSQGYMTVGARADTSDSITLRDNAELDCLTLQSRAGNATILITNNAAFKVFNVLAGSGTINYPDVECYWGCVYSTNSVITVAGHGLFYVDSFGLFGQTYSNLVNGLSIGNGGYAGGVVGHVGYAGSGALIIKDYGTLDLRQGLHLGTADATNSQGTLEVVGPNATVNIGGDLRLAVNLTNAAVSGVGMIDEVITGSQQSTINVGGKAWLTNGVLKVQLQGYTPVGGEKYTLVSAGSVDGVPKAVDLSDAPLASGLTWQVSATSTNLLLAVVNTNTLPALTIQPSGSNLLVSWPGTNGILQSSTNVMTGWSDIVPTASSPYTVNPTNAARFFRLRQ